MEAGLPALGLAAEAKQPPAWDFGSVVVDHQRMVFSLAYHFLHDAALAEEVAQDVFVRLYNHLNSITSEIHLRHWLRRAAIRHSIDEARRRNRHPRLSLEEVAESASGWAPEDSLLREKLRRLVRSLPEAPRAVMILRYQENLTPQEIAGVLEMPIASVKSHLQRSLELLRAKIGRQFGDFI